MFITSNAPNFYSVSNHYNSKVPPRFLWRIYFLPLTPCPLFASSTSIALSTFIESFLHKTPVFSFLFRRSLLCPQVLTLQNYQTLVQKKISLQSPFHQHLIFLPKLNHSRKHHHTHFCIMQSFCPPTHQILFALHAVTSFEQVRNDFGWKLRAEIFRDSVFKDNFWGAFEKVILWIGSADWEFFM